MGAEEILDAAQYGLFILLVGEGERHTEAEFWALVSQVNIFLCSNLGTLLKTFGLCLNGTSVQTIVFQSKNLRK